MPKKGHIPERTCIVCKKKTNKYELLRLCLKDGKVVVDKFQKLGGRGAYLCPGCIPKLKNRKNLRRLMYALRIKEPVEVDLNVSK